MNDPFTSPRPRVLPSILSADFARLADDCRDALRHGGDFLHVDVMDGHLVPNISFGTPVIARLRRALPEAFLDVHLMIDAPVDFAESMVRAGANNLTFHIESPQVAADPVAAVREIRRHCPRVGVTMKPATPVESILPVLPLVDLVLIMSVEPGFGGQAFMPDQLDKARLLVPLLARHQRLQIDGGINTDTISTAREAGVEWFVVGSALFDAADRASTIACLRELAGAGPVT